MSNNIFKIIAVLGVFTFLTVEAKENCTPELKLAQPSSIAQSTNTAIILKILLDMLIYTKCMLIINPYKSPLINANIS